MVFRINFRIFSFCRQPHTGIMRSCSNICYIYVVNRYVECTTSQHETGEGERKMYGILQGSGLKWWKKTGKIQKVVRHQMEENHFVLSQAHTNYYTISDIPTIQSSYAVFLYCIQIISCATIRSNVKLQEDLGR